MTELIHPLGGRGLRHVFSVVTIGRLWIFVFSSAIAS